MNIKERCLKRLNLLKDMGAPYMGTAIKQFSQGEIPMWENQGKFFDTVYYGLYINKGQEMYNKIAEAVHKEEEGGAKVYMVTISHTEFGTVADLWFVSPSEDESWDKDFEACAKKGYAYVHCVNLDDPMMSDYGDIGFAVSKVCGGIKRTY